MKIILFRSLFLTVVCSAFSCMTVPISERKAFNLLPESLEMSLGAQSYQAMLQQEKILRDEKWNTIMRRVGGRIAEVSNQPDYKWEFKVIDSKEKNAFCLPGGKIAAYRGIFDVAKNEAGLATVLAHEVAHALARHGGQRISANLALVGGLTVLSETTLKNHRNADIIMAALGLGSQVGLLLPYSRMQEKEADEIGQVLMARAGYDPRESVKFWDRFAQMAEGPRMPEFLSTHPGSDNRKENLEKLLSKTLPIYEQTSNKHGLGEVF